MSTRIFIREKDDSRKAHEHWTTVHFCTFCIDMSVSRRSERPTETRLTFGSAACFDENR